MISEGLVKIKRMFGCFKRHHQVIFSIKTHSITQLLMVLFTATCKLHSYDFLKFMELTVLRPKLFNFIKSREVYFLIKECVLRLLNI